MVQKILIIAIISIIIIILISIGIYTYYAEKNDIKKTNNIEKSELTLKRIYEIFNNISIDLYNKKFNNKYLNPPLNNFLKKNLDNFSQIIEIKDHIITRSNNDAIVEFIVKLKDGEFGKIKCKYDNYNPIIYDIDDVLLNNINIDIKNKSNKRGK